MFLVIFVFFLWTEYISQVSIRYVTTVHSKFFFLFLLQLEIHLTQYKSFKNPCIKAKGISQYSMTPNS